MVKKILIFLALFLSFAFFVFNFLNFNKKSKAANESKTTVIFEPSNDPLKMAIKIKSNTTTVVPMQGYVFHFNFDKTKLKVLNIEYKVGGAIAGLSDMFGTLEKVNQEGKLRIIGEVQNQIGAQISPEGVEVAKIFFQPLDQNQLILNLQRGFVYTINADNTLNEETIATINIDLKTGSTSINPSVNLTQTIIGSHIINLKTKFQGINSKPANNSMTIKVKISGCGITPQEKTIVLNANDQGIWSGKVGFNLNNCSTGNGYILYLKGPKHIQKKVCDNTPSELSAGTYRCSEGKISLSAGENNLDLSGILLLSGDLDQNGVVDSTDISLVRNNLGKKDADILSKADINLDGIVDTQDFSLILGALSVKVDEM